MLDTFIVTPSGFILDEAVGSSGIVADRLDGGGYAFGGLEDLVDVLETPEVLGYYDESEREFLRSCGSDPRVFHVRYYNESDAERVIVSVFPSLDTFVIDNDHGLLLTLQEFGRLLAAFPGWRWGLTDEAPANDSRSRCEK